MDGQAREVVDRIEAMIDRLDEERMTTIAVAYAAAGFPNAKYAHTAASMANRSETVSEVMACLSMSVMMHAVANGMDLHEARMVEKAVKNAGIGLVTEDLIGRAAYNVTEYGALVEPWFAGFFDELFGEKGEAA